MNENDKINLISTIENITELSEDETTVMTTTSYFNDLETVNEVTVKNSFITKLILFLCLHKMLNP